MYSMLMSGLPLGLDGVKVALHLLNLAILMVGLTLLFYKPILKFIKKRQDGIKNQLDENEENKKKAENMLSDYQKRLDNADAEIDQKKVEAIRAIEREKEAVLDAAQLKADELFKRAEEEVAFERSQAISNLQNEVAEVAINIAGNILEREISVEENQKIIDACIREWTDND